MTLDFFPILLRNLQIIPFVIFNEGLKLGLDEDLALLNF